VLGLSALALPEQSRAGCSPNLHWTDFGPVWSPTGDRIAYQRIEIGCFAPRRTYVIDSDGGAPVPMPLGGERPSWSPDGRRLAFSANLTVANADGGRDAVAADRLDRVAADCEYAPPLAQ
jgi:hypothetical protein